MRRVNPIGEQAITITMTQDDFEKNITKEQRLISIIEKQKKIVELQQEIQELLGE